MQVCDRYARPSQIRDAGRLSPAAAPDSRLGPLVERVSRAIDDHCSRTFGLWRGPITISGHAYEGRIPIPDAQTIYSVQSEGIDISYTPVRMSSTEAYTHLLVGGSYATITIDGLWGYSSSAVQVGTLQAAAGAGDTTLQVTGEPLEVGDVLLIDDEVLQVTATSPITVTRGCNGTTAAAHSSGVAVMRKTYPGPIVQACIMQVIRVSQEQAGAFGGALAAGDVGGMPFSSAYPIIRDLLTPYRLQWAL